jgi:membrane-associated phospholipid phosphatase
MIAFAAFALAFLILWLLLHRIGHLVGPPVARLGRLVIGWLLDLPPLKRWIAARERRASWREYMPVVLLVVAGLVISLLAAGVFLNLAEALQSESQTLERIDLEAHQQARDLHGGGADPFFVFVTHAGSPLALTAMVIAVAAFLLFRRRWQLVVYLLFTTAIGGLLIRVLKAYFARERPDLTEAMVTASGYAFPSGHAMSSTIVFTTLAYVAHRHFRQWRIESAMIAFAITAIVAVSLSRVYLGVHWLSDISAGIVGGLAWVGTITLAYETLRRIDSVRKGRTRHLRR